MQRARTLGITGLALWLGFAATASFGQELGQKEPIRQDFSKFLQAEFGTVPAAYIVANVPKSTCQQMRLPANTKAGLQVFLCNVDVGCNDIRQVPVGVLPDGRLAFFPDSPEQVVYYNCPASISDPARRADIEKKLALPPIKITKIK